jgi:ABC-2 type transport system ATP-binding protein
MEHILSIQNLSKQFASTKALDNVTFNVERGSITGLIGPNGAGKTTMLRIINNILVADSGNITVNGIPVSMQTSPLLGYMPEERGLYDKMRISDQIMYFGMLKKGNPKRLKEIMNEYLELFNLKGESNRRIKELSKGNQQKVQIIATLVHEPELVMLDEPFSGFYPINGALLQELISRLNSRGTTIMLSSHNMSAIEEMCDNVALIDHGKILLDGNITQIRENHTDHKLSLTTRRAVNTELLNDSKTIQSITTITNTKRSGYSYIIQKAQGISNADLLSAISMQAEITHFEELLPSLSDLFIKYTATTPQQ